MEIMGKKEIQVIRGLAEALGLPEDAEDFDVLKTAAEALGCHVAGDGTTIINVRNYINMHATLVLQPATKCPGAFTPVPPRRERTIEKMHPTTKDHHSENDPGRTHQFPMILKVARRMRKRRTGRM